MRAFGCSTAALLLAAATLAAPADAGESGYCLPSNVKLAGTAAGTQAAQEAATGSSTCNAAITYPGGEHDYGRHGLVWDAEIMLYGDDDLKEDEPKPAYCLPRKTELVPLNGSIIVIGAVMQTHRYLEVRIESDRKATCKLSNAPPPSIGQTVYVREEELRTAFEMNR